MIPGIVAGGMIVAGGGGAGSLYDEIMADSPEWYVRLNETSGTNANNETGGADGAYGAGVVLNQPAIYTGGSVCSIFEKTSGTDYVEMGNSFPFSTGDVTFMTVIKPTTVGGVQSIISKDEGTGSRSFQWRMNGTSLEWVKIIGGVETITKTGVFTANVACMLHVTITSGGSIAFFKNGVSIHTGSSGATSYATSNSLRIGFATGPGASMDGYIADCAGFGSVLSSARIAAHAAAAGF